MIYHSKQVIHCDYSTYSVHETTQQFSYTLSTTFCIMQA